MATGRNNATIAKTLFMSERAVEKHIGSVFQKLGLVEEREINRRVMAVLAFLEAVGPAADGAPPGWPHWRRGVSHPADYGTPCGTPEHGSACPVGGSRGGS